jgi:hypothetical protein
MLCEAARATKLFLMFALAGRVRGASERYRITAPALQELRCVLDDPRNRSPDSTADQENFARTLLLTAIGAVIEAADARPVRNSDVQGAYAECGVPGGVLRLVCERVGPYAPGNPRFQEVRVALFAAQGVPRGCLPSAAAACK